MDLFVFSSRSLTNIWAGIGANQWAVSQRTPSAMRELETKSQRMPIGALGVLYCSEAQALTTPFIVYSTPDPNTQITDIWPEAWVMPFKIHPLGTPRKLLTNAVSQTILPIFAARGTTNISHAFNLQATTVFVPTVITSEDWRLLLEHLRE